MDDEIGAKLRSARETAGLSLSNVAPAVMSEALHGAFTAMFGPGLSVEEWWDRSESYGRDYMTLGAGELSARLVADMVRLQQYVDDPAVWAPASCLMTVYGKTLPTNQGRKGAISWYQLAARLADRSGDLPTRVWVRGRAALALAYEGAELRTAGRWAEDAVALSQTPSMGRLNALLARVHVISARGELTATERALDDARREFDVSGSHEQESDFAMPEWRFAIHESMLFSRLGDERATAAQDTVDRLRPASLPRFGTHVELHRGLMLARAGDTTGGVQYARTGLERLPEGKRSLSLQLMMAEVEQTTRSG
ncbi:MAG: XRE family transcriptional regulator [Actinobacteria bacterium]|nr:XRE family transcriptional regulator [Actinomycetota bacterium]